MDKTTQELNLYGSYETVVVRLMLGSDDSFPDTLRYVSQLSTTPPVYGNRRTASAL